MVSARIRTARIILIWLILTETWSIVSNLVPIRNLSTISYIALLMFWIFSLRDEIPDPYIRRRLIAGAVTLIILMVLRYVRYNISVTGSDLYRYLRYAYYLPSILTAYLSISIALYIGSRENGRQRKAVKILGYIACILILLVFTNDIHHKLLNIWYEDGKEHSTSGPVFYIIMAWYVLTVLISFAVILYKCRVKEAVIHWRLPATIGLIGMALWAAYYANGGSSPHLFGLSLYNIQEVTMFMFMCTWDSCILIGLIPSNSLIKEREWIKEGIRRNLVNELDLISRIYTRMQSEEGEVFRQSLSDICCVGAYIKRRANLELIADERGYLSTAELSLAIRESFDYYAIAGISVGYEETGDVMAPAPLVISAYELFEEIMQKACHSACYVKIQATETDDAQIRFNMIIETDAEPGYTIRNKSISDAGFMAAMNSRVDIKEQDDTTNIVLSSGYSKYSKKIYKMPPFMGGYRQNSFGVYGLAVFLSLNEQLLKEKISVHDSLGRSLLMSKRYLTIKDVSDGSKPSKEDIITEWGRALAVIDDRYDTSVSTTVVEEYDKLIARAKSMGIDIVLTGSIPKEPVIAEVVDSAITVHITNIIKHTTGKRALIDIVDSEDGYVLTLRNDGRSLETEHKESGGLKNLRARVEAVGGSMNVDYEPFCLRIKLPVTDLYSDTSKGD